MFSTAMFFCFQLVHAPVQAESALPCAVDVLERAGGGGLPIAAQALVLNVLVPLFTENYIEMEEHKREADAKVRGFEPTI